MRKTIAAATMAASLTIGGAAGVAIFSPTLSGAQTDDTAQTEDARPEPGERILAALSPLVEDGTITQAQADAVAETLVESAGDFREHRQERHRRGHMIKATMSNVAEVLGLDAADLRSQLAEGATIGDIAESQGVSDQDVIDAIVTPIAERLEEAVANGNLTEEEAAEKLAAANEKANELLDKVFDGRPGGPGGPDADTTES